LAGCRSISVDGLIVAARSRPIINVSAGPKHTRLPPAPQKAAENTADPKNQDWAEAERSHDEPANQRHATAHSVRLFPA